MFFSTFKIQYFAQSYNVCITFINHYVEPSIVLCECFPLPTPLCSPLVLIHEVPIVHSAYSNVSTGMTERLLKMRTHSTWRTLDNMD